MRLIFLDLDGIFNTHEPLCPDANCATFDRRKIMMFNGVLRRTGARVVLSSAWRYIVHRGESEVRGMDWMLRSHGLMAGRLIGITRRDTLTERIAKWNYGQPWIHTPERGDQIDDYLAMLDYLGCTPERYVAVDDLDLGISSACHPFVRVDGTVGLTEKDCEKIVAVLERR